MANKLLHLKSTHAGCPCNLTFGGGAEFLGEQLFRVGFFFPREIASVLPGCHTLQELSCLDPKLFQSLSAGGSVWGDLPTIQPFFNQQGGRLRNPALEISLGKGTEFWALWVFRHVKGLKKPLNFNKNQYTCREERVKYGI